VHKRLLLWFSVLFEGEHRNAACSLRNHLRQSKDAVAVQSVFLKS
jgi:hypothetical protein